MSNVPTNNNGQATMANSQPVVLPSDQSAVPVSAASLPLPSGAATSAAQGTGNTSVASIDTKTPALGQALAAASVPVVLTAAQITTLTPVSTVTANAGTGTLAVSLASVPSHAVTNAGTFAVQAAEADGANVTLGSKADAKNAATDTTAVSAISVLKQISASVQAPPSQAVTGTFWQATQPVSGTVTTTPPANASTNVAQLAGTTTDTNSGVKSAGTLRVVLATDQPALTNKLLVTPDSVALPANQSVNVAQVGGTNMVNGGVAGSQSIGGTVATNVAITDNPINNGAQAVSSENTAVTTARKVQLVADLVGKLIVLPYANPENFVSGAITTAMTGTTTTSLLAAPAAGLRNYITQITVSNSHATVGTDVIIQDGSGGTTLYTIPAAAVYGGAVITFPTPLRQPTTATAIFCANVTTGASTKVSASGYKGA